MSLSFAGEKTPAKAERAEIKMKRIFCLIYTVMCLGFHSTSQNLVPNGDFEYYTSCPTLFSQFNLAYPWYDPNGASSDYYNACAPVSSYVNVPDQTGGAWQLAHSGVGYAGLWARQCVGCNYREYIQVQLTDTLKNNSCYYVEFYANLYNKLRIGVNNIGAYISQTAVTCTAPNPLGFTPQILLPGNPPIIDTVNWVKVSGLYTANGGEQYITIGNLLDDTNTTFQVIDTSSNFDDAYYFIDDVSMYEIKTTNAGRDTTICHGDSVQLGNGNYETLQYSWQPTTGLSNPNIGSPKASPSVTTTYYLTQTTPCNVLIDTVVVNVGNCTVGMHDETKLELSLSPNPATNEFTIKNAGLRMNAILIYNVLGEEVLKLERIANSEKVIDVSEWKAGLYFVEVETEKGIVRRKVIKSTKY